ncbi:MAG: hypothetical protein U1E37_07615 [Sphingomonadaceae bacterium]
MAESDKPFICYKSGWSMKIVPRNKAGWIALAWWMLSLVPLTGGFIWLLADEPTAGKAAAYTAAYTLVMLGWAIGMIVWTKNRSEVVDMEELLKLRRELDARKNRGRRG